MVIGDLINGGIVFYVDPSGEHGLVCSLQDQCSKVAWGCLNTLIGASGTDNGTGSQNTNLIDSGCATVGIAAKLCKQFTYEGYSDWFLPSKDELNLMYLNIPGKLTPNYYWSSSESNNKFAWQQHFQTGTQCRIYKNIVAYIRAIRAF
jgi:hypothetical protein